MEQEFVQPKRTGKKATALVTIEVMVEVLESDSYADMTEQAKEAVGKRVLPGHGFHPFRSSVRTIHPDVEVAELKQHTEVPASEAWRGARR